MAPFRSRKSRAGRRRDGAGHEGRFSSGSPSAPAPAALATLPPCDAAMLVLGSYCDGGGGACGADPGLGNCVVAASRRRRLQSVGSEAMSVYMVIGWPGSSKKKKSGAGGPEWWVWLVLALAIAVLLCVCGVSGSARSGGIFLLRRRDSAAAAAAASCRRPKRL